MVCFWIGLAVIPGFWWFGLPSVVVMLCYACGLEIWGVLFLW